jgi:transcriptional repressor NrdR
MPFVRIFSAYHEGRFIDMRCPYCRHADSRVVDSREAEDGQIIRRRRSCPECGRRFTTVEEAVLAVVKRSGVTEPFSRTKIVAGVRKACQGRPVDEDAIALLAQKVEETVRARGAAELPSHEVGLAILAPLRELDEVAYLRFASVYRSFDSLGDFEREIAALRAGSSGQQGGHRPGSQPGNPSQQTLGQHTQGQTPGDPPTPAARAAEVGDGALAATGGMRTARPIG